MADMSAQLNNASGQEADPIARLVRLNAPLRESGVRSFFSNFRDFLFERPKKIRGAQPTAFDLPGFGASLRENARELFRSAPRGEVNSGLLVNWKESSSLWQNIRDIIAPPKLPPLKTTSAPVAVPEIWSKNTQFTRVQALSLAFHVVVLVLIIVPLLPELMSPPTTQAKTISVTPLEIASPYLPKLPPGTKKAGGGGGGGEHNILPASKGKLPKFSWTQFTPPRVKTPDNPKLAMTPTVLGPPDLKLPSPNMANWGDPLAKVTNDSSGPGSGGGIGSGCCGGVGSGNGRGVGPGNGWGTGGGNPTAGENGYGTPVCLYCPSAKFSDDAVKAKHQGAVVLAIVVGPDGRASSIHVSQGLGMGLDEEAVAAVKTWRFTPAKGPDGKPTSVSMFIEVSFRLY
jgi:periplasmic protein TonB